MNIRFHIGMALCVLGLVLFIFAEEVVDTYEGTGEAEYNYSDDRERMRQLQESEF